MTRWIPSTSVQSHARAAGVLYLIIIVLGIWSEVFVRSALVTPGDAATSARAILAAEGLYRVAFAADSVMALSDVALAILLFGLLRPVSPLLALMAAAFRLVQAAIIGGNLMNHHAALLILKGAGDLTGLDADQIGALALLTTQIHGHGYDLGLIFFGLNSLITGWLILRAPFLPSVIGVLIAAAGVVYLTGSYLRFLAPALAEAFAPVYVVPLVAELSFCLWLLIRGVNAPEWARCESEARTA